MLSRRAFTRRATAVAVLAGSRRLGLDAFVSQSPTQETLIIDAMGEIREVYTDALVREMIDSGLNSVTTLSPDLSC